MDRQDLRDLKKGIDFTFKDFSRTYGESIENFFDPLLYFLVWFEQLLLATPWPVFIAIASGLAYLGSRSWKLALGTAFAFLLIGYMGMWKDTMSTVALVSVATLLCILIGIPIGILMARSDRVQALITPILDIMQTIPIFVYLLPVVILKIGRRLFFRMFRFEIVLGLLTVLVFIVFASLAGSVVQIEKEDTLGQIRIGVFCMFFSIMCLMKLRLVVGGVILVRDWGVRKSFGCLRQYRIRDGGAMLVVFGVSVAVRSVVLYLLQSATFFEKDTLVYSVVNGAVIGVAVVLWGLCSVWFVGRFATVRGS